MGVMYNICASARMSELREHTGHKEAEGRPAFRTGRVWGGV